MFDSSSRIFSGRRLKIVHCVRAPIGGIFRHVLDLAAEQTARGHLVGIVLDSTSGGAFEAEKIAAAAPHLALGVVRLPMSRTIRPADLVSAWRVFDVVKRLGPDIIHGHGAKGGVFARVVGTLLSRPGKPVARFYTPHGGSLHYGKGSLIGRLIFGVERQLERLCDGLIHVSRFEADLYRTKVGSPACETRTILNGLRAEEFVPVEANPDASDLLFMGMVRELKGPDVLIRAVAKIRDRTGRAPTTAVLGDGPDLDKMKHLAQTLGLGDSIRFHGPKPTRVGFAMGRMLVVPSRAESMPYIVLEAVAAARPTILSHVGGIPEILGPKAQNLVPPGDVDALADAIEHGLADVAEAERQALSSRRSLRNRFTIETMTAEIERLYLSALAQREAVAGGRVAPALQPAE